MSVFTMEQLNTLRNDVLLSTVRTKEDRHKQNLLLQLIDEAIDEEAMYMNMAMEYEMRDEIHDLVGTKY